MKRPLCLFVFSFAVLCFIMQIISVPLSFGAASADGSGPPDGSTIRIVGRLCKKEKKNDKLIYYLKEVQIIQSDTSDSITDQNSGSNNFSQTICYMDECADEELPIGVRLCMEGTAASFDAAENEGQFDSRAYYKSLGYGFRMFRCEVLATGMEYNHFEEILVDIKSSVRDVYEKNMKPENAGILCAMLLGDKTGMDAEIKNLYRKNGIAHVLAISGLHISLLGMLFYKLLRRLGIFPWLCSCVGILLVVVYIKFVGFSTSSFRATCMFILFLLADILGRTYDLKTAMAFSALLLFLKDPAVVVQAGFLLSYLAVMGLTWVNPVLQPAGKEDKRAEDKQPEGREAEGREAEGREAEGREAEGRKAARLLSSLRSLCFRMLRRLKESLKSSLLSGFSVQVFILPVSLWFYYEFPIGSFLLNLIIIPCMTFILISGLVGVLPGCQIILIAADRLLDFYEWLCRLAEQFPGAVIVTGRPAVWQMVLYYGLVLFWLYFSSKNKMHPGHREHRKYCEKRKHQKHQKLCERRIPAFVVLLLCMLLFLIPAHRSNRVDMLSIGQGDCVCMRDDRGNTVLIDGGSTDVKEAGKYRLLPFLKYHGISEVQLAFISHAHTDHYSAILELLEMSRSEGVRVRVLCLTKLAKGNESYTDIVEAAQRAGTKIVYIDAGDRISCGEMTFDCVYPAEETTTVPTGEAGSDHDIRMSYPADENDASMVLLARLRGFSMLFTGDSTEKCDAEVIRRLKDIGIAEISCLKTAHHGAQTSTSAELLTAFDFEAALISCGKDNSYGHPHSQLLARLQVAGCRTFVTSDVGQITLEIGGDVGTEIKVHTWRSPEN